MVQQTPAPAADTEIRQNVPRRPAAVVGRLLGSGGSGTGGPVAGLIGLVVLMAIVAPNFTHARNLMNIVDQVTVLGVLALGATAVIIIGGIDLSVGSILAVSSMVLGWTFHFGGLPMGLAILAAIASGAALGVVNGLGVTLAKLPPFIATLAMMSVARGLANLFTDGQQIVGFPDWFVALSSHRFLGMFSATALVLIALYVAGWIFFNFRQSGRELYAIGGNQEVARLAGIGVRSLSIKVYAFAGALAGLGGVMLSSRLNSSQPGSGVGYELDVIAAVVIGGASLSGGTGKVTGTIVGVLIIGVLRNGLNLLGVSAYSQQIVIGVVIALAVSLDVLRNRSKK